MAQYGIRLVINIFDLCIFWRFLEIFIGKRRTSAEISIMLILVCEAAGSIINLKEINWMNLITLAVILGIFICQYEEKISTKVVAVMMYMGLVVVAEPVGYIIYRASVIQLLTDERAVYYITVFAMELFRAILVEVFCRIKMGKVLRLGAMPREVIYMHSDSACESGWLFSADRGSTGTAISADCNFVHVYHFYNHLNRLHGVSYDGKLFRYGRKAA